jgi:hypothetical protein
MLESLVIGFVVFGVVAFFALAVVFLISAVFVVIQAIDNTGEEDPWNP